MMIYDYDDDDNYYYDDDDNCDSINRLIIKTHND